IFGVQDMVTHHLDIPFYVTTFAFVMNKAKIDGLSPEDRKVIDDHCNSEWAGKMPTAWADAEAAGRAKLDELDNQTFYKPTEEEMAQWKEATGFLQGEWSKAVEAKGEDPEAVWNRLMESLEKHDSAVQYSRRDRRGGLQRPPPLSCGTSLSEFEAWRAEGLRSET